MRLSAIGEGGNWLPSSGLSSANTRSTRGCIFEFAPRDLLRRWSLPQRRAGTVSKLTGDSSARSPMSFSPENCGDAVLSPSVDGHKRRSLLAMRVPLRALRRASIAALHTGASLSARREANLTVSSGVFAAFFMVGEVINGPPLFPLTTSLRSVSARGRGCLLRLRLRTSTPCDPRAGVHNVLRVPCHRNVGTHCTARNVLTLAPPSPPKATKTPRHSTRRL